MIELWAYPGTLSAMGTESSLESLADRGVDGVSVSAHQHSARVFCPRAATTVRWASGCWFDPDRERFGAVEPPAITEADGTLDEAARAARDAGLSVAGWTVALHGSRLGARNPDYRTEDAFGTPHDHALCPSHAPVRAYFDTLTEAIAERPVDALDLESVWLRSVFHGHDAVAGHEASAVPAGDTARALYSLCFCDACRRAAVHGVGHATAAESTGFDASFTEAMDTGSDAVDETGLVGVLGPAPDPDAESSETPAGLAAVRRLDRETAGVFPDEAAFDAARDRVQELLADPLSDQRARLPPLSELVAREPALARLFAFRGRVVTRLLGRMHTDTTIVSVQVRDDRPNRWGGRRLAALDRYADRLTVRCYGLDSDDARARAARLDEATDATVDAALMLDSFDDAAGLAETIDAVREVAERVRLFSHATATDTHLDWIERAAD